jgi:hypothetical protein
LGSTEVGREGWNSAGEGIRRGREGEVLIHLIYTSGLGGLGLTRWLGDCILKGNA